MKDQFSCQTWWSTHEAQILSPCRSRTWRWKSLAAQARVPTRKTRDHIQTLILSPKGPLIPSSELPAPVQHRHGTSGAVLTIIPVGPTQDLVEPSVGTPPLGESHSLHSPVMWCWRMRMSLRSGWPRLSQAFTSRSSHFPMEEMTWNGFASGSKSLYLGLAPVSKCTRCSCAPASGVACCSRHALVYLLGKYSPNYS